MKFCFLRGSVNHAQISCLQLFLLETCQKNPAISLSFGPCGKVTDLHSEGRNTLRRHLL